MVVEIRILAPRAALDFKPWSVPKRAEKAQTRRSLAANGSVEVEVVSARLANRMQGPRGNMVVF